MKNTASKHNRLTTSLALGASVLGAASSHAGLVYWDTSETVTSILMTDSREVVDISFDSITHQIALGGSFGDDESRGVELSAAGYTGKGGNRLDMMPVGWTSGLKGGTIVGKGGWIGVGTTIGSNSGFAEYNIGWGVGLDHGLTDFYVGIRLSADNQASDNYNYGWASISTSADGLSATLNRIAFESDINTPITVTGLTAVPEPGNLVSLAALVGSATLLRSRRKTAATAA